MFQIYLLFYIRVENSSYVFVLFPRLPTPRLARYALHLPCFRFRGRSYGRGAGKQPRSGPFEFRQINQPQYTSCG